MPNGECPPFVTPPRPGLPVTGLDVTPALWLAAGLILSGAILIRREQLLPVPVHTDGN
jgi:hypothetical protein